MSTMMGLGDSQAVSSAKGGASRLDFLADALKSPADWAAGWTGGSGGGVLVVWEDPLLPSLSCTCSPVGLTRHVRGLAYHSRGGWLFAGKGTSRRSYSRVASLLLKVLGDPLESG